MENQKVIIIIGGGLSGLSAADYLLNNGKNENLKVIVLQAMDRVGGKTITKQILGTKFDLGAQFIGKSQKYVIQLANRAHQQFIPENYQGNKILYLNGKKSTYSSDIPSNINILALIQMEFTMWKINRMAKKVSTLDPKSCQLGSYWDSITLQTWISKNIWSEKVKLLFQAALRILLGSQLSQVSFLYFLWFVNQNQSFHNLITIKNGLQQKKLKNGTQQLSFFLRKQIQKYGGEIHLNQKVKQISQLQNIINVYTGSGKCYKCDYLIMATGPSIYRKIEFKPQLSPERNYFVQKSFIGNITKVVLLYEKQFWKQKGFSGQIVTDCYDNPIVSCFDDTKYNDNGQIKQPALIVFIGAQVYRYWKQKGKQILTQSLCSKLVQAFQSPQLKNPMAVQWYQFDQQTTLGGGPVGVMPPGVLSHIQNLRKPQHNIHFAGTETATVSIGYMDGAIESGIRASKQILQKISLKEKIESKQNQQKSSDELGIKQYPWYNKLIRNSQKCIEWI